MPEGRWLNPTEKKIQFLFQMLGSCFLYVSLVDSEQTPKDELKNLVEDFDNITSKSGNTFLVNILGLGTKLPNCKNEPSKEQDCGVGPSKESSSSRIPSCGDPAGLTVGNLEMLCLRRRANSSYAFERQMIRRH
jgi:hypothetical protein